MASRVQKELIKKLLTVVSFLEVAEEHASSNLRHMRGTYVALLRNIAERAVKEVLASGSQAPQRVSSAIFAACFMAMAAFEEKTRGDDSTSVSLMVQLDNLMDFIAFRMKSEMTLRSATEVRRITGSFLAEVFLMLATVSRGAPLSAPGFSEEISELSHCLSDKLGENALAQMQRQLVDTFDHNVCSFVFREQHGGTLEQGGTLEVFRNATTRMLNEFKLPEAK